MYGHTWLCCNYIKSDKIPSPQESSVYSVMPCKSSYQSQHQQLKPSCIADVAGVFRTHLLPVVHIKTTDFPVLWSLPESLPPSLDKGGCLGWLSPYVEHLSCSPQMWAEHSSERTSSVTMTGSSSWVTGLHLRNLDMLHRNPLLEGYAGGTSLNQVTPSDEVNLEWRQEGYRTGRNERWKCF